MRVVLLAPEIPDYALEYARILSGTCKVLLIIPDKFRADYPPPDPNLEVRWVAWPRQRSLGNVPFMMRLSRQIRIWKPDAVHCLDANYIWFNLLLLLLRPIPFVTTIHDIYVHPGDGNTQKVPRLAVKMLIGRSTALVVHGDKLRADAVKEMPIDQSRIFIFPVPPINRYLELAKREGITKAADGLFRILFFGRIQEYKGLKYLIEAAPTIHEKIPNAVFVIAGKGDDFQIYRDSIVDPSYFQIHNRFIAEAEAAQMFTDADLLALPYIEASQSGVLLIALPMALPVIATDVGEMGDTVRSTGMGLVVPPRDPVLFASAVIEFASNSDQRNATHTNMARIMQEEFSLSNLSARALAMYEQVVKLDRLAQKNSGMSDQGGV